MSDFHEAAQQKFDRGQKEHGDWNDIDPVAELSDELLDVYWYASHDKFPPALGKRLRMIAKIYWDRLNP